MEGKAPEQIETSVEPVLAGSRKKGGVALQTLRRWSGQQTSDVKRAFLNAIAQKPWS